MKLVWDQIGEKKYESGVSSGVLYPMVGGTYPKGVAWNGLTGVTESPTGAEAKALYADNSKYLSLTSAEEFAATLTAYFYPDEFAVLDGSAELVPGVTVGQQKRGIFGLAYKTDIGTDVDENAGYIIKLVYGAQAAPSEKAHSSKNDSPDAVNMSWKLSTTPVKVAGFKPTATLNIDSTKLSAEKLALVENVLFGTDSTDAHLPFPDEIATIIGESGVPALTMTILPADDASAVAVGASVVMTFSNKISTEAVIVTKADGSIVNGTKTFDSARKVLTFKSTSNLSSGTTYLITIGGVTDVYGQVLAATVMNFTTV